MPKTKRDGAVDPTIYKFLMTANLNNYALLNAKWPKSTSVFHINLSWQKYSLAKSVLGDSYGPAAETRTKWEKKLERDFQISNQAPFNK